MLRNQHSRNAVAALQTEIVCSPVDRVGLVSWSVITKVAFFRVSLGGAAQRFQLLWTVEKEVRGTV